MWGDLNQVRGPSGTAVVLILSWRQGHVKGVPEFMEQILDLVKAQELNVQRKAIDHVGNWLLTWKPSCTLFSQSLSLIFVMLLLMMEHINVYFASSHEAYLE